MITGIWGKKVGMTQVFSGDKVVPVTVIDAGNWYVTQIKTAEKDGYTAIQVGCVKPRYADKEFDAEWLKKPANYFSELREVTVSEIPENLATGNAVDLGSVLAEGTEVDVFGITKGAGFQGAVKRHGFGGGRASHGDKTGRRTGGIGFFRAEGRVIKGKRMPGHMGVNKRVMKNLEVVKVDSDSRLLLIKGSVPGKTGSLVFVRKNG